ncbi:kinase-like protein [Lentinus tigrinus ALCF2SS1-7]|uniref:Kinase-like protein n=1 Tax=Lentinus tigrinus ALCF2SS1-6 TaxID=1328759 RepID=A0A5C2SMW0_9APHY|nr:kinase-like protein [Lentinus tigrinus ALCF2SS1-6]RPD76629.1 kinase-like protein [Lentinus tigrinus ALCF2SS1-7]
MAQENGEKHSQAATEPSRKQSGDGSDKRSSSPVPSPGSDDNGRRGRSRTRTHATPRSEDTYKRRGYHALMSSFGKVFHVEKRWKLIRELGSGAYGFVISAADEISGEPVAIKMVTRALEKVALAKRVLREITLLRHFAHENITGLIDVDCTPDMSEIYIFMEPMEADLHQIIKSGQALTNEHVQYFVYQILRGMKYIHSASVVHRDLKPGNLLVNADCELKICDFGLSRGFNSAPDENPTLMTEYVATRWYRAPEIMLVYKAYNTAIDVWSIGCIMAELIMGKPLFKGKDYVDQLNKILDVVGTPDNEVVTRIASPKAQAYLRSLPYKKRVPFEKLIPTADPQAVDLLTKLLVFDPASRITVQQALEHPWLAAYHDVSDEPSCPEVFERWRDIEKLETLPEFKEAIWNEIQDYRKEVRSIYYDAQESPDGSPIPDHQPPETSLAPAAEELMSPFELKPSAEVPRVQSPESTEPLDVVSPSSIGLATVTETEAPSTEFPSTTRPDPSSERGDSVAPYPRRPSFMRPSRTNSMYSTYAARNRHSIAYQPESRNSLERGPDGESSVAFPTQEYVVPARSRTASMFGDFSARKLLRTLSTVSIYESGEGLAGGLADIAPIGKYIVERDEALPSGMPQELDSQSPPQPKSGSSNGSRKDGEKRFHIQQ